MRIELQTIKASKVSTHCLVVVVLDQGEKNKVKPIVCSDEQKLIQAASDVVSSGELSGKLLETVFLHNPAGLNARHLLLLGGGRAASFGTAQLRRVAGTAMRFVKSKNIKNFAMLVPEQGSTADRNLPAALRAVVEGAIVGDFEPDTYKSDRIEHQVDELTVVVSSYEGKKRNDLQEALESSQIVAESQNFTRQLVNEPGNNMTPTILARRAQEMAGEVGLKCEILDSEQLQKHKMGAFWSVAKGSDEPPALIVLRYEPSGAPRTPVLGLVGKGVTFDSGGISIKPSEGMEKMKYDMAGGAAMIGAMRAIALLKAKIKVIGIVCAAENMPSGKAFKPGDIEISMSGKSIEIINTDAEGRLILADGLSYARKLGCTHLIDAATLTGACVVALGTVNAGIFSNDEGMYERFQAAQQSAGEKFWRLPLDEEYKDLLKSNIADMINSGGRWGGAITAAMFLKEFAEDTPWIHLDIAGVAWVDENKPWIAKGPSGIAVRSVVDLVRGFAQS